MLREAQALESLWTESTLSRALSWEELAGVLWQALLAATDAINGVLGLVSGASSRVSQW